MSTVSGEIISDKQKEQTQKRVDLLERRFSNNGKVPLLGNFQKQKTQNTLDIVQGTSPATKQIIYEAQRDQEEDEDYEKKERSEKDELAQPNSFIEGKQKQQSIWNKEQSLEQDDQFDGDAQDSFLNNGILNAPLEKLSEDQQEMILCEQQQKPNSDQFIIVNKQNGKVINESEKKGGFQQANVTGVSAQTNFIQGSISNSREKVDNKNYKPSNQNNMNTNEKGIVDASTLGMKKLTNYFGQTNKVSSKISTAQQQQQQQQQQQYQQQQQQQQGYNKDQYLQLQLGSPSASQPIVSSQPTSTKKQTSLDINNGQMGQQSSPSLQMNSLIQTKVSLMNSSALFQTAQSSQVQSNNMNGFYNNNNNNNNNYNNNNQNVANNNQTTLFEAQLELKYNNLVEDIKNRDQQLLERNNLIKYLEQDKMTIQKELTQLDESFSSYKQKIQKIVTQQILESEKFRREEIRLTIQRDKQRLGEYVQTRDCTKFDDTWQEGIEFKKIKERLKAIDAEKEELEKKKKNIKVNRKSNTEGDILQDFACQDAKQRINLHMQYLQKEEQDINETYKTLDHEKFLFIQRLKRFQDEQNSRYGQSWPVLGERYQLLSLLGKGGFSEVYKAYDLQEFKEVACKIHQLNLNWTEQAKANYIKHAVRESKIHSELKHPNIVQLFDTVEIDNNSFATILEFCEGPDLYFYLKKNKALIEKDAKMLVKQIMNALKYMNSQKTRIIHYDLKPQNIIFHKGELKISDFGLSKIFEDGQTRMELTSQGVGTYWYLPPETFESERSAQISPKVDIWSVGVIFFEMVFGQRPFGNNKSQDQILKEGIILKSTSVNFPNKPNVSNECKEFIKNCLTYDQNRRWDIQKAWESPYMSPKQNLNKN